MNEMKKPINWVILLLLIVGTVLVVRHDGKGAAKAWYTNQGRIFGTVYKITYSHTADVQPLVENRLHEVDNSLSPFNEQSVITHINRNESMATDSLFRIVWHKAEEVYRLTNGAFDITCAPLVNAWGFGFRNASSVTPEAIDSLLEFVGMSKVRMVCDTIVKEDARTLFDCSAIAKGFGSDYVAALFDSLGVTDYMVEIGGEVVTRGNGPKGDGWRIGISKPNDEDNGIQTNELDTILTLTNCGMATSGNYRNFYYKDGKKYAHTVDPRIGVPVQHSVLSATVIAPTCMEADALATSFMVMGVDSARTLLSTRPDLRAYLICDTDTGMVSVHIGDF